MVASIEVADTDFRHMSVWGYNLELDDKLFLLADRQTFAFLTTYKNVKNLKSVIEQFNF